MCENILRMNYQWSSMSPIHSSSDNFGNTPSSPTRRRSMSSERLPPHSPVVVAQAQSSVLSPTRGDEPGTHPDEGRRTASPSDSVEDRFNHGMRSVSPSMLTEDSPSSSVQSTTSYSSPGQFAVPARFERPLPPKFALRMGARERLDCHQQFPTLSNHRLKVEAVGSTQRQQADSSFRPVPIKSEHVQHYRANGQRDVGKSVGLRKLYLTTHGEIRETVTNAEAASSTRVEWCNSAGIPDRFPEALRSDMTVRDFNPKDLCSRELLHRRIKSEQNKDTTFMSPLPMSPPHSQGVTKLESAQYSIIDYSIPRYSSPSYSSSLVDTTPPPSPSEPNSRGDNGGRTRNMLAVQPRYAADSTQQSLCGSLLPPTSTPYGHQTATACISPQYTDKNTNDALKPKQHGYSVAPSCNGSLGILPSQSSVSVPTSTCPSIVSPMSTSSNCSEDQPPTEVASGNLCAVIDKIIIEFDGTTLLCRVCGDRSSGFHYGVHSCEGCKGFFRRSIQQKIQYRQCSKNQQCLVQKTNRNRCQYCRLKKCIEVGMSKDAVRFGRVPKNEKERIRLAMEKASNNSPQQEFNDDFLIQSITSRYIRSSELLAGETIRDIIRRAEESPNVSPISTCPLNPYVGTDDFNQKFSPMVREVVTFAKNIPGFTDIRHDDKITLLRACVFEVLLIRFGALIDSKNRKMVTVSGCIIYASIYSNVKASHDFVNTLFKFIDRINALNLTDEEMALFLAAIVINPKRQGLSELSKITTLHKRIVHCLQLVMQRERPNNPNLYQELVGSLNDLWILNGMHSKQTQGKHRNTSAEESMDGVTSGVQTELGNNQFPLYQDYPEMPTCPISSSYLASSPEYEDKRRTVDETSPTSPTSTFSPDEEMRSPGSADSGCSTDSGCSIESGCSSDSGCSVSSNSMLSSESSCRRHGLHSEDHRESISCPDDETTEKLRKCHIKRKPHTNGDDSSRLEVEKSSLSPWHKPQQEVEKTTDSPVLRKCLESPVTFKMEAFGDFYRNRSAHRHKKFRPAVERPLLQEVLDSSTCSPHPSTSPSLSYSSSPSPSSSISSSPSRYSSDFGSSLSSPSSYSPSSILAQRLRLPSSKYPETTSLLSQEPKFGSSKEAVRDTLYDCIMSGQSKIPRQPLVAYDISRPSPYPSCHMSSPHSTSPPPSHHSSPHHQFSSSPYLDDAQPLNLSTKTPSPPPVMEA